MFNRDAIYALYAKESDGITVDMELVKTGFNLWAFVFTGLWAVYHKLWLLALILIILSSALAGLEVNGMVSLEVLGVLRLGLSLWAGFDGNDWRETSLEKRGYTLVDVILARSEQEAQRRYLDKQYWESKFSRAAVS